MPRVEGYGSPRVDVRPLPSARRQAHETPESQGAGIGEAMAGFGQTAARLGTQLLDEVVRTERAKVDEVAELTFRRQLKDLEHQLLHAPDSGLLNKTGLEPMQRRDDALKAFDLQASEIEKSLLPRLRSRFYETKEERRAAIRQAIDVHASGQVRVYEDRETRAALESSVTAAIANVDKPGGIARLAEELAEQARIVERHGPSMGLGPEAQKVFLEDFRSKTHEGVIARFLVLDEDQAAKAYFDEVRDQLSGEAIARIEEKVQAASTDGDALRAAAEIWAQHMPVDDDDPIHIDRMLDVARERLSGNPQVLKLAIEYLKEHKAGVDAGRRERRDARDSALWTAVAEGASLGAVRRMPEFKAASGQVQRQIRDYFVDEAEKQERLAYTREGRAYQREQRALAAEERRDRELERRSMSRYYELSDPTRLAGMSRADILRELPVIGHAHVGRLLTKHEQLAKDANAIREAQIDADLFDSIARAAGVTDDADLGELRNSVEAAIDVEQRRHNNRVLTREEKGVLMRNLVDQKVMVDRTLWGDESIIAGVVNREDQTKAYVPLGDIPQQNIREAINYLRSVTPAFQRLTDEQIRARAARAIERAYAAKLLRLGREEEIRRLKEASGF